MKLKKYENKELRKSKIISFVLACACIISIGTIIYQSYANYQMKATFRIINGKLKMSSGSGDIEFAFYKGDQKLDTLPLKGNKEGIVFVKATCTNDAILKWDDNNWDNIIVNNLKKTKTSCSLYFGSKTEKICTSAGEESGSCYLAKKSDNDKTNFAYDDTNDTNLRYIGLTPNNYVNFNNEVYETDVYYGFKTSTSTIDYKIYTSYEECSTAKSYNYSCTKIHEAGESMWHIIGVMNNITEVSEDGKNTEAQGSHIKIIRDKFDTLLSWDSSEGYPNDGSGINAGSGINEWSASDIEKVLNDEYLNRRIGSNICYKNYGNITETCPNWADIGIREEARNMISSVKWNTGTMSVEYDANKNLMTASYMYEAERSNNNGNELCLVNGENWCNDKVPRSVTWIGKIGLMYPSDYGYAVGDDVRQTCLGKTMSDYRNDNCKENDWLLDNINNQWTMTPVPHSKQASLIFYVVRSGVVYSISAYNDMAIRPTLYLKSDVKIKPNNADNYGSADNPFILEY